MVPAGGLGGDRYQLVDWGGDMVPAGGLGGDRYQLVDWEANIVSKEYSVDWGGGHL